MSKSTHTADDAMLSELPNATSFFASLFIGRGAYDRHESKTLAQARDIGRRMAEHHANGRSAMIYAQLPSGRQFLVPDSYNGESTMDTKTFAKRFNAQRAAKSALGADAAEGIDFATSKAEGGWTWAAIAKPPPATPAPPTAPRKRAPKVDSAGMPVAPDFSAKTHARYRGKLETLTAMVTERDVEGLKAFHINPVSTSPKALMRYRDAAIAALTAQPAP